MRLLHIASFICLLSASAAIINLPQAEINGLIALCQSITPWCPNGYQNPGYDFCGVQTGLYVTCIANSVSSLILENVPGNVQLSGVIPTEIGLLTNLKVFHARSNAISGFLPTELGNTKIYDFNLNGNNLIGSIPSELGKLGLVGFEIASNQLNGQIPPVIFNPNLLTFNVGYNSLTGTIPSEIGLSTKLAFAQLNNNQLTGTLPTSIGQCSLLFQLLLSYNALQGTVPTEIGNLKAASAFSITSNGFSGQIPTQIGAMQPGRGSYFLLGANAFSGTLPTELGLLTGLTQLAIYNSPLLTGTLPSELGKMSALGSLWIFSTSVYDVLPSTINQLTNLISLRVQSNLLSGTLPNLQATFGSQRNNTSFQEIWLQGNYFSGQLPAFANQVVMDCDDTLMTPFEICRSPRVCNNTAAERVTNFNVNQLCVAPNGVLSGTISFSPAVSDGCFSDYLLYFVNNLQVPLTSTPVARIPKAPLTTAAYSINMNGLSTSGARYLAVYSYAGVPPSPPSNTPALYDLTGISSCSSSTRTPSPSRSVSPSIAPSGPNGNGGNVNTQTGGGGGGASPAVGIGVAAALVGVACVIVAFVIYRRRKARGRTIIASTKEYDPSL